MFKKYGLTALLATLAWAITNYYYQINPMPNQEWAGFLYGVMMPPAIYACWWNLDGIWKNIFHFEIPPPFEKLRIPFAAVILGVNSAIYDIHYADTETMLINDENVRNLWLGLEIALTIALIIGLYHCDAWQRPNNCSNLGKGNGK
jgi:hypothetical protein